MSHRRRTHSASRRAAAAQAHHRCQDAVCWQRLRLSPLQSRRTVAAATVEALAVPAAMGAAGSVVGLGVVVRVVGSDEAGLAVGLAEEE